jgi:hypothetical protein
VAPRLRGSSTHQQRAANRRTPRRALRYRGACTRACAVGGPGGGGHGGRPIGEEAGKTHSTNREPEASGLHCLLSTLRQIRKAGSESKTKTKQEKLRGLNHQQTHGQLQLMPEVAANTRRNRTFFYNVLRRCQSPCTYKNQVQIKKNKLRHETISIWRCHF